MSTKTTQPPEKLPPSDVGEGSEPQTRSSHTETSIPEKAQDSEDEALEVLLRGILAGAQPAPPRSIPEVHDAAVEPGPAPPAAAASSDAKPDPCCPICKRLDTECQDHLLAWHLYPSGGNGFDGQLADEEIDTLLGAVRLAWILSVRGNELPIPIAPAWIWEERALRDYFYQLGSLRELQLDDDEPDEEAADRLRELAWDHSLLVRDFLMKLLPDCGWEGLVTERLDELDPDFPIEGLSSAAWWSTDPSGVTERLRAKLVTMLAKAEPVAGKA